MPNKTVNCVVLKQEAEALESPPYPGELGQRVFENVSKEGWSRWLERLVTIINENGLNTSDSKTLEVIEENMKGFLFGEGDSGHLPAGFNPAGEGGGGPSAKK
jgi:Fe-S cluster biosynthesis and repair protein YggX